ncbi:bifunctional glycosyltransferase/CDP-glycerol:glycerophosphate glycerophosphotransferase [Streptomyces sp. URMC 123]|uniref:bifunctional glycosyltransferase/CDP-glycerol:glycerophosphate glycerophosphotransferase n=1 Tax=Streptomyces sp. URMC 123 TaxID=3423403 RepID=UPI003F1BAC14
MPRFSVVVAAHKVQAYLHECLDSVLQQSFTDFELIAVDDCSPDACGRIIDEYAARDHRVIALHLPENVGLGPARNAGTARATGDYLLYLDGDDSYTPGTLRALADRLKETSDPDLLLFDYARTHWDRTVERNPRAHLLERRDPQIFTLADRPELLRLLMVAWNKACRRDFARRVGLTFPPGFYEDTPWSYPALLSAESIAVLDRVCVHYRQRRLGSILGTPGLGHFDVFNQYDRVFAFLDEHPHLAHWRPLVYRRMLDHFTTVFTAPSRLPAGTRAEFFRRVRAACRTHRPEGARGVAGRAGVRHALLSAGARRTFQLLWRGERLREGARRGGARLLGRARAAGAYAHYRLHRLLPVRSDLAVFSAYWHRGYACNPAAIEAKVRELAPHIRTLWITTEDRAHTLPAGVGRLEPGSAACWAALARAKYLVNNVNFPHRWSRRPGQVHLQTHHGTPLKRMGLDLQDHPAAAHGLDFARLLRHTDRWSHSLSANPHSTLVWERVYPSAYATLEYGYPRNDVFLSATAEDVRRARLRLGIPFGTTAVLYAPTHRDYRRDHRPRLDLARVSRALGPGVVLLNRAHYFAERGPSTSPGAPPAGARAEEPSRPRTVVDVSDHPSVEELCLAADALVTDYSSIMFDYANLDRPIVVLADDWEIYRATRGTYLDLPAEPPGPVARSEDELIEVFATGEWCGPRSAELRAAFRERFCPYDDGRAAERVVRHLFLGEEPGVPRVLPPAERRPAPAPRVL